MSWIDKFFGDKEKNYAHSEISRPNVPKPEAQDGKIGDEEMEAYYNGKMSVEEIDHRFQKMQELQDVAQPNGNLSNEGAVQPNDTSLSNGGAVQMIDGDAPSSIEFNPKGQNQLNGVILPKGSNTPYIPKYYLDEETKLTIILVENTEEVAKQKDKLKQIVNSLVVAGQICVINYGKLVRESKIVQAKDFDCSTLLYEEFAGNAACLFDALIALEGVVDKNYKKTEEIKYRRVRTKSIEIIGIGRCVDNCSITSSQAAIESFTRVVKHRDVTTKYFCLREESFMQAATIGFHSIGAIARNYM